MLWECLVEEHCGLCSGQMEDRGDDKFTRCLLRVVCDQWGQVIRATFEA